VSNIKIKRKQTTKQLNRRLKAAFNELQDDKDSGRFAPVRSLKGIIHCGYEEHPMLVTISASETGELAPETYLRMSSLSEATLEMVAEELSLNKHMILEPELKSEETVECLE